MRIDRLKKLMISKNIDYVVITNTQNIAYYTNYRFGVGERMIALIIAPNKKPVLILNKLFDIYNIDDLNVVFYYDHQEPVEMLSSGIKGIVAVDNEFVSKFLLKLQKINPTLELTNGDIIDEVRAVKSSDELAKMRAASLINDEVMAKVFDRISVGISEQELAEYIITEFNKYDNTTLAFSPIVAFGSNCADPHAHPSNRKLIESESIIVDMGCNHNGYCSDMTRTFFINNNPITEIYDAVLQANLKAIEMIKPGVQFKDIDKAARDVIETAGYGEYFIHRLGHGIGMKCHEPFDVSGTNEMIVKEGMCFSIEPGIYIKDKYGVRIEDLVIVTKDGVEVINHYPKDKQAKRSNL